MPLMIRLLRPIFGENLHSLRPNALERFITKQGLILRSFALALA